MIMNVWGINRNLWLWMSKELIEIFLYFIAVKQKLSDLPLRGEHFWLGTINQSQGILTDIQLKEV